MKPRCVTYPKQVRYNTHWMPWRTHRHTLNAMTHTLTNLECHGAHIDTPWMPWRTHCHTLNAMAHTLTNLECHDAHIDKPWMIWRTHWQTLNDMTHTFTHLECHDAHIHTPWMPWRTRTLTHLECHDAHINWHILGAMLYAVTHIGTIFLSWQCGIVFHCRTSTNCFLVVSISVTFVLLYRPAGAPSVLFFTASKQVNLLKTGEHDDEAQNLCRRTFLDKQREARN